MRRVLLSRLLLSRLLFDCPLFRRYQCPITELKTDNIRNLCTNNRNGIAVVYFYYNALCNLRDERFGVVARFLGYVFIIYTVSHFGLYWFTYHEQIFNFGVKFSHELLLFWCFGFFVDSYFLREGFDRETIYLFIMFRKNILL